MDQIPCDHVLFVIASYTAIREKKNTENSRKKKKKEKKTKTKTKKKRRKKAFLATSCLVWLYIAFYFLFFLVKITPECLFLFNQFKVGKWTIFSFSRLHVPFIVVQQM